MTTLLCPKHGDPRDTSVMRPQEAPCNCRFDMCCKQCGSFLSAVTFTCVREKYHNATKDREYTFMEHLRVF
jgi:hypothetical protein